jgi:hypothetical protein
MIPLSSKCWILYTSSLSGASSIISGCSFFLQRLSIISSIPEPIYRQRQHINIIKLESKRTNYTYGQGYHMHDRYWIQLTHWLWYYMYQVYLLWCRSFWACPRPQERWCVIDWYHVGAVVPLKDTCILIRNIRVQVDTDHLCRKYALTICDIHSKMHTACIWLQNCFTPSKCIELRYAKLSFQLVTRIPYGRIVDPLSLSLTCCTSSVGEYIHTRTCIHI